MIYTVEFLPIIRATAKSHIFMGIYFSSSNSNGSSNDGPGPKRVLKMESQQGRDLPLFTCVRDRDYEITRVLSSPKNGQKTP